MCLLIVLEDSMGKFSDVILEVVVSDRHGQITLLNRAVSFLNR